MSTEHLMVPTQDWLRVESNTLTAGGYPSWSSSWYQGAWWPYYCPVTVTTSARPIRLTMAEIEHLRMHAAGNPKLKAILQKFTDQIEIIVDFT